MKNAGHKLFKSRKKINSSIYHEKLYNPVTITNYAKDYC